MKATGLVRRMDDLGRIVIPKDLRRKLALKEGDGLEFFYTKDEIILKRYCEPAPSGILTDAIQALESMSNDIDPDSKDMITFENLIKQLQKINKELKDFEENYE